MAYLLVGSYCGLLWISISSGRLKAKMRSYNAPASALKGIVLLTFPLLTLSGCSPAKETTAESSAPPSSTDVPASDYDESGELLAPPVPTVQSNLTMVPHPHVVSNTNRAEADLPWDAKDVGVEPISDGDIASVAGDFVEKAEWHDAGLGSISALVETYYWAMRDGNLDRYSECLCQYKQYLFSLRRSEALKAEFEAAVMNVLRYNVAAVVRTNDQVVAVVAHTVGSSGLRYEFLAVLKVQGQFRIQGEKGYLPYGHQGWVPIPLLLGYKKLQR